jgi:LPPG:FO 2-phospho-L-lactate transferase
MIVVLAGGVGAAKFLRGLVQVIDPRNVTIIGNTGDDVDFYGLRISPDLDILLYTLAGLADPQRGWGIEGDTFHCLDQISRYGEETWFQLGDRDLAIHIERTHLLHEGWSLSQVTDHLREALQVLPKILPMSDQRVTTHIATPDGSMHFQEYLVKRRAVDGVLSVSYQNAENARPAPAVLETLEQAVGIVIAPSNPVASIGPILSVPGIGEALRRAQARAAKTVAISPIVGGVTLKGPADKFLRALGFEVSPYGVARFYLSRDLQLDALVIDTVDAPQKNKIKALGIKTPVTDTIMKGPREAKALAECVVKELQV